MSSQANKQSDRRLLSWFSGMRIRTKLQAIIGLIVIFFSIMVLTVVASFHRIEDVLGGVINDDVNNVMTNALTEQELTSIAADLNLLLGTFFENDAHLYSEGEQLLRITRDLVRGVEGSELEEPLGLFGRRMEILLEQCKAVNSELLSVNDAENEIASGFDRLEEVIAAKLIEATFSGDETSTLQQLAVLIVGYRQSLLEIGKQHAERWPKSYYALLDVDEDPLIDAVNELDFRLRTLIGSDTQIINLGSDVIRGLQKYKNGLLSLNTLMVELRKRMLETEDTKIQATEILTKSDRNVVQAINAANSKVLRTFRVVEASLIVISLALITTLVVLTLFFFSSIIKKPMDDIRDGIKAFRRGNLNTHIDLQRNDEWCLIEDALNDMAAELSTSYKELKTTQRFVSNIIDSMPSVLVGVDSKGRITQWNQQAERVTGILSDKAVSSTLDTVYPSLVDQMGNIKNVLRTRQPIYAPKVPHVVKTEKRYEDITIYPLVANGVEGAVIRVDDVTREKAMEDELNTTRKMEAIGLLAGGVAHDFNNMLAAIMSATELLGFYLPDESVEPKSKKLHQMILDASNRAAGLTKQLLAFSRQADKVSTIIKLHEIIDETLIILKSSIDRRITMEVNLNATDDHIVGDPSLLQNSLLNLCINASHAMPEGGLLKISTHELEIDDLFCQTSSFTLESGKFIELEVRDSGCGIPQEDLVRIFEPFFTTKKEGKGTGLGLSTVYGTVQHHKGAITVYSEMDAGTVFKILLPLSSGKEGEDRKEVEVLHGSGCILVVDDEEIMRFTAKEILEKYGYTVLLAENGKEAVELFCNEESKIDLVLLDMIMPVMNGRDCFKRLKQIDPTVKVVLSSGFSREEDFQEMMQAGLSGFIRKPYLTSALCRMVHDALN